MIALTLRRAAICAVFKTTKVSTLGKTTDITCELHTIHVREYEKETESH